MKSFHFLVLTFGVLFISWATASAQQEYAVVRAAEGMPRVLNGNLARADLAFRFDEPRKRRSTPVLSLEWKTSAALQEKDPTLTVRLDGAPIKTFLLAHTGNGTGEVLLPSVKAGYHVVEVTARIGQEECAADQRDERWISLEKAEVSWLATEKQDTSVGAALDALLRRSSRRIQVHVPLDERHSTVEVLIELDNWARRLGRYAIAAKSARNADIAVAFDDAVRCELPAVVSVRAGNSLHLSACEPSSIARFFAFIDERALRGCDEIQCYYNTEAFSAGDIASESHPDKARFTLKDLGLPAGWTARGEGHQAFEVTWIPAANVDIRRWPEFELEATWNLPERIVGLDASVTVELNGRPIGSWKLAGADQGRLVARVPEYHFDERTWKFRTSVHLRSDAKRCDALDRNALWFQVSESSELRVEHDRYYHKGLAQLWLEHRGAEIDVALDSASPSQALAIAAITYAMRTGRSRVRVVGECGSRPCLRLGPELPSRQSPVELRRMDNIALWRLRIHSSATRMLPAANSIVVHARNSSVIDVYVSSAFISTGKVLVPPQLGDFDTETAFFLDDAWESVGAKTTPATTITAVLPTSEKKQPARVPTTESSTVAQVDIALVVCGLLVLAWAILYERGRMRDVS